MKNLIVLISLLMTANSFAQDKSSCGNCNEKYLKVRTFGGTNLVVVNQTHYVFYKLYTPDSKTCLSQNTASNEVVEAFQAALEKNEKYQEVLKQYEAKWGYAHSKANYLVGRSVHWTDDHNSILDPFKGRAESFNSEVQYIELDFDIEGLFSDYILCN